MDSLSPFRKNGKGSSQPRSGWRRAAHVNSAVLAVITIILACFLVASTSRTGSWTKANMFFTRTCNDGSAAKLNVSLHLLVNIVSTAVFASSNFFMQVVNSPSRREVDAAHAKGSYLSIGVPSIRNAFLVSRFKTCCWVILLLSSIPIHFISNSMIFQTESRVGDYQLTIAANDFANGAQYFAPGASLQPAGYWIHQNKSDVPPNIATWGWGFEVWMGDYEDPNSDLRNNISLTAVNGAKWEKLSAADCYNMYVTCEGLKTHSNVILVSNTTFSWVRDEMWHLNQNESELWDPIVPGNESNSLFFHARCTVSQAGFCLAWNSASNQGETDERHV